MTNPEALKRLEQLKQNGVAVGSFPDPQYVREQLERQSIVDATIDHAIEAVRAWEAVKEMCTSNRLGFVSIEQMSKGHYECVLYGDSNCDERDLEGTGPTPQAAVLAAAGGTQ